MFLEPGLPMWGLTLVGEGWGAQGGVWSWWVLKTCRQVTQAPNAPSPDVLPPSLCLPPSCRRFRT